MKTISNFANPFALSAFLSFLLFGWRPFFLGFYSDDYSLFVEPLAIITPVSEVAFDLVKIYVNRPISGLLSACSVILCRDNPFHWHLLLMVQGILITVAVAFAVKKLAALIFLANGKTESMLYLLWPCLPVTYGFLAWPTYCMGGFCFLSYVLAVCVLLSSNPWRVVLGLAGFGLSIFTLEHFYFQLFPLLCLLFWKRKILKYKRDELKTLIFGFLIIQFAALSLNRLVAEGIRKTFSPGFIVTRIFGVIANPEYIHHALIPIAGLIASLWFIQEILRYQKLKTNIPESLILMGIALLGICLSALVCLIAGYSIRPFGVGSRTSMVFSFWIVFFCLGMVMAIKPLFLQKSIVGGLLCMLLILNVWQGNQWAASWKRQKKVLADVPVESFSQLPFGACVVGLVPNYQGDVLVFDEDWTLGPAIVSAYPNLKNKNLKIIPHKNRGFSKADLIFTDGKISRISKLSGHKLADIQARDLYLWNSYSGNLFRVVGPWHLPVDQDPFQVKETNLQKIL